jgi:hypothetical protein
MQIHRIVLTVIDFDELGAEEVGSVLENARYPNHCISPSVLQIDTREIGEWTDEHPLNQSETAAAEIDRLFGAIIDA